MTKFLGPYSEYAYAALRIIAGLLFACHGAQKLFGVLGAEAEIGDPLGFTAGVIEFFGELLIALGLIASYAAFVASGEMAVAYFKAHAVRGYWPILNRGETAILYCFIFLCIAFRGAGLLSLDALFQRQQK